MTVIWRFIHNDKVQVGALALLIMSAWAVFLAAAYNDQKALQDRCTHVNEHRCSNGDCFQCAARRSHKNPTGGEKHG